MGRRNRGLTMLVRPHAGCERRRTTMPDGFCWLLGPGTTKKGLIFPELSEPDLEESPRRQTPKSSLRPRRRRGAVTGNARESARWKKKDRISLPHPKGPQKHIQYNEKDSSQGFEIPPRTIVLVQAGALAASAMAARQLDHRLLYRHLLIAAYSITTCSIATCSITACYIATCSIPPARSPPGRSPPA